MVVQARGLESIYQYGGDRMNKFLVILVAALGLAICNQTSAANPQLDQYDQSLDTYMAWQLMYLHDQEKLARDINRTFYYTWGKPIFASIAESEQRHMNVLRAILDYYYLSALVETDEVGVFGAHHHTEAFTDLVNQGEVSLTEAYRAVGYLEEWDIREIRGSIEFTQDQALIDTFSNLLAGARNHLRVFAARSNSLGYAYQAQMLKQSEVDDICSGFEAIPGPGFSINPGLNDAWYFPDTDGQGFLITVYPNLQTVFVAWFTFDTELPGANAPSKLGNAGQRWLTAQGNYVGGQAELAVYSSSDGRFDMGTPRPKPKQIGSLLLQFEDCAHGSVFYDLQTINRSGMVPIERIAPDNVAQCELNTQ